MNFRAPEFSPEKQLAFDKINKAREKERNPADPEISVEDQERALLDIKEGESAIDYINGGTQEALKDLARFIESVVKESTKRILDIDDSNKLGDQKNNLMALLDKGPLYKVLILESLQSSAYRAGVRSEENANLEREMGEDL